jgi:uridine phosphorylase
MSQFKPEDMTDTEFPVDPKGRTYHVTTKKGEVANRIICVGDLTRAERLAKHFFGEGKYFELKSYRGFATFSGKYKGVPISIIGTGMGLAMTDFTIRETLHVVDGEVVMIRLGTCGTPRDDLEVGNIVVNDSSTLITRNVNAFRRDVSPNEEPYHISNLAYSDKEVVEKLQKHASNIIGKDKVVVGINASADSFYHSQGRVYKEFDDRNENIIDKLTKKYTISSIEMESFHLFDLAECNLEKRLKVASACIVLAQRSKKEFLKNELKYQREIELGQAGLETLIEIKLKNEMKGDECVWEKL